MIVPSISACYGRFHVKSLKHVIALAVAGMMLGGCAANNTVETFPELVWPEPPEQARIIFVKELVNETNYERTTVERIKNFLMGRRPGGALVQPNDVTVDSIGNVYIADTGMGYVVVFDDTLKAMRSIGASGKGKLYQPYGIANLDDTLYVTDGHLASIKVYTTSGEYLREIGGKDTFMRPSGIRIDRETRRLYVVDTGLHTVKVLDIDSGAELFVIGERGSDDGFFNYPGNIEVSNEKLYVVDAMNFRIQIFSLDGTFLRKFGQAGSSPGTVFRPKGIGIDKTGTYIFLVDSHFNNFQIFDDKGRAYMFVGGPGGAIGSFISPTGLFMNDDIIYVADRGNRRIQIFKFLGSE